MKKKMILTSILLSAGIIGLSSYKTGPAHGGLGNRTGSTGGSNSCSMGGCHPSESSSLLLTLTLTDNATSAVVTDGEYEPGHEYTVKLSGAYSGSAVYTHLGFQASVVTGSGADAGVISATEPSTGTISAGGVTLVEHTAPLPKTGDAFEVTFRWTAPAAGSGDAKFYARMLANNNNSSSIDDTPNRIQVTYAEKTSTAISGISNNIVTEIYPNPSEDLLHIKMAPATAGNYSLVIRDISGRIVHSGNYKVTGDHFDQPLAIHHLADGSYTLSVSNGRQASVAKFVKK